MSQSLQSDPGQRDKVLGQLLLQALHRRTLSQGPADLTTCPGAEMLSAYVDRAIDSEENARCELHFADCVRCRSTLAAFMARSEVPQVVPEVRKPASVGPRAVTPAGVLVQQKMKARQTIEIPERVRVEQEVLARQAAVATATIALPTARWALRWIAPAISLAVGAAIGYALHSGPRVGTAHIPARLKADSGWESLLEGDSPSDDIHSTPSPPPSATGFFGTSSNGIFRTGGGSGPASSSSGGISNSVARAGEVFASSTVNPVASSPAQTSVFGSPDGKAFWRIGLSGRIEHSIDQGRNWLAQPSGVSAGLVTGVAVSDQVAWVIGQGGVLLRTTDGKQWQRVATPGSSAGTQTNGARLGEVATAPLQWIQVAATDALHAIVTSSDSQRFATANGGLTWNPVTPAAP